MTLKQSKGQILICSRLLIKICIPQFQLSKHFILDAKERQIYIQSIVAYIVGAGFHGIHEILGPLVHCLELVPKEIYPAIINDFISIYRTSSPEKRSAIINYLNELMPDIEADQRKELALQAFGMHKELVEIFLQDKETSKLFDDYFKWNPIFTISYLDGVIIISSRSKQQGSYLCTYSLHSIASTIKSVLSKLGLTSQEISKIFNHFGNEIQVTIKDEEISNRLKIVMVNKVPLSEKK